MAQYIVETQRARERESRVLAGNGNFVIRVSDIVEGKWSPRSVEVDTLTLSAALSFAEENRDYYLFINVLPEEHFYALHPNCRPKPRVRADVSGSSVVGYGGFVHGGCRTVYWW